MEFPCFVSFNLYRHCNNIANGKMVANLLCFYEAFKKHAKFVIPLILIGYFTKLMYRMIIDRLTK
jgi:hypothetical protein